MRKLVRAIPMSAKTTAICVTLGILLAIAVVGYRVAYLVHGTRRLEGASVALMDRAYRRLCEYHDLTHIGAAATDSNGVVVNANPAADAILGPMIAFGQNPWGLADYWHLAGSIQRESVVCFVWPLSNLAICDVGGHATGHREL